MTKKEQVSGRQKMAIDVSFKFLKILGDKEARNPATIPLSLGDFHDHK